MKVFNLERLGEASTYRGLLVLLGLIGVKISPAQSNDIITACLTLYGLIGVFFPDTIKKSTPAETEPERIRARTTAKLRDPK